MTSTAEVAGELTPGRVVIGKFRIVRVIGSGGMGVVLEAVNEQLEQPVALKFLRQDLERSPAVVERFAREARAAVKLRSEHVVRVSDVGEHPTCGPFMVMDLLEGRSLSAVLSDGPLPLHRAVEYVIHACEGLAEAHARGIVHQDVKPGNLFLAHGSDGRPAVKVLDFGISKVKMSEPLAADPATTGRTSGNMGTPHYLSPEQLRAKDVDLRADIWALGCVLFELLTREKAYRADRFSELVVKILEAPRAPVPAGVEVPDDLLAIVDRCLEKDRARRYATTAELALALLPFAQRRAHAVAARAVGHVRDAGLAPHLTMPSSMPPRPSDPSIGILVTGEQLRAPNVPDFPAAEQASASAPPRDAEPKKRPLAALAIGALVLAVALIALFVVTRRSGPADLEGGPIGALSSVPGVAPTPPAPPSVAASVAPALTPSAAPEAGVATPAPTASPAAVQTTRRLLPVAPPASSPARRPADTDIRNER